ncbi:EF-hand domain-containing protein [Streptomyces sp. 1222.5]|uniref:EF-hand domain-containing protein n=1 Tax=Streptomyces sp. 1222.5 TaxID=1881026 RepID=UPI003D73EA73
MSKRADFDALDSDGDGFITAAEFKAALQDAAHGRVSDENAAQIVRMADLNRDRRISYREYCKLVR